MNKYVIINADNIKSRINELEKIDDKELWEHTEYDVLRYVLFNSISLMPEIEKAYDGGILHNELSLSFDYPRNRYMSHLKFDI